MKDLTKANGLVVVERQRARVAPDDPSVSNLNGVVSGAEIRTVDEILLEDGSVRFQCVHPNGPDCDYTAETVRSVTAHQRTHSDRMLAKRTQETLAAKEAELAEIAAKKQAEFERRSNGMKKAHEARKATMINAPVEIGGHGGRSGGKGDAKTAIGDANLAKQAQNVIIAFNAMQAAADEFTKVLTGYMRAAQTASAAPAIDPQILAKAQQYDAMKAAMKAMNDL